MSLEQQSDSQLVQSGAGKRLSLLDKLKLSLFQERKSRSGVRQVAIIVNPAAGRDAPFLKTFNSVFREAGAEWDLFVTHRRGDGRRLARAALHAGADVVVAFGGDGTVNEVANGLVGARVPMAILPTGTTNVISAAFGIPRDLRQACELIVDQGAEVRAVDVARIGKQYFLQLVGIGMEARMVENAGRELKEHFGMLAYGLAALHALGNPSQAHYRLALDGQTVALDGVSCLVASGSNMGLSSLATSDGLLDVVILRQADFSSLITLAARIAGAPDNTEIMPHWHARQVTVEADPPQTVQADGDVIGLTPVKINVTPQAVRVIVPGNGGPPRAE